jgi:prolyl 4-hydroxylase
MALYLLLFLLRVSADDSVQSHYSCGFALLSNTATAPLAFAQGGGGGGGGFGSSNAKKTRSKPNNNNKRRKRAGTLSELEKRSPVTEKKEEQPLLDKWGLPPPTEEDLFPPMPPGTELISASQEGPTSLQDIKAALKDHTTIIALNLLEESFDSTRVEKSPTPGNAPMKLNLLHKSPPVLSIDNFFTMEECEDCKKVVTTKKDDAAFQVGSATFSPLATSKRTSTSWFCHYSQMPTLLAKTNRRLGIPLTHMEEPQIVRYRSGEEFSWHYDEVPPTQLDNGGQRLATLLVYLNTVTRVGGTIFRDLLDAEGNPLTVKPVQGSALLFFPAFGDGRPDDRTLHRGEMVDDEKWIAQMWIHERPYSPVVPPGNTHEAALSAILQVSENLGYYINNETIS